MSGREMWYRMLSTITIIVRRGSALSRLPFHHRSNSKISLFRRCRTLIIPQRLNIFHCASFIFHRNFNFNISSHSSRESSQHALSRLYFTVLWLDFHCTKVAELTFHQDFARTNIQNPGRGPEARKNTLNFSPRDKLLGKDNDIQNDKLVYLNILGTTLLSIKHVCKAELALFNSMSGVGGINFFPEAKERAGNPKLVATIQSKCQVATHKRDGENRLRV